MRYTKEVVQQLLDINEGFEKTKSFVGRNFKETNYYLIKGGKLFIRSKGKSSWADSRYDNNTIADMEQARRFLKTVIDEIKTDRLK